MKRIGIAALALAVLLSAIACGGEAEAFLGTRTLVSEDVTGHLYTPEELNRRETLELKRDEYHGI